MDVTLDLAARAVAAALLHSVWQGALAAALAGLALRLLRDAAPQARYSVACVALAALLCGWTVTAARTAAGATGALEPVTVTDPAPLLGAGPFDFSSAVRDIRPSDLGPAPRPSWPSRLERWAAAAVPVWIIGVAVLSMRLAAGWLWIERLRRRHVTPAASALRARVAAIAQRTRVSRPVRVVQSAAIHVPSVVGWLRPVILLPARAVTGLTPLQLDAVIAHELAHVRRHDYAVNLLQSVAETLLFYHPACWWIARRIRIEREHCCDDVAVAICGDRLAYATALADLESLRPPHAFALAASDGPLLHRVRRLLAPTPGSGSAPAWAATALPLATFAIVIGAAVVTKAQQAPEQMRVPGMARTVPGDRGVVEGRVIEAHTGRPIAGARVELRSRGTTQFVTTDEAGRYTTSPLTPGTFTVSVTAPGYATAFYDGHAASMSEKTTMSMTGAVAASGESGGSKRITMAGNMDIIRSTTLDVGAGVRLSDIDVAMQATVQLSGRILDDRGRGLAGAYVQLIVVRPAETNMMPRVAFARSEADGTYRVTAPPGDYTVRSYTGTTVRPSKDAALIYVSTFYPGVPSQDDAHVIRLEAGADQYDVDFALLSGRSVRVAGMVVDPSGRDLEDVTLSLRALPPASGQTSVSLPLNARGEFDSHDVIPGTYAVEITDPRRPERWKNPRLPLEITEDVTGLEIRANAPASLVGRVVRDPASAGRVNLAQTVISFVNRGEGLAANMSAFNLDEDGAFRGEVPAGRLSLTVFGPPEWVTRAIRLDGADVFGFPIELGPGAHEIEVVITDRLSSVNGVVVDRRGTPLGGFDVVLFPQDETRWFFMSPLIRQTRSHQNGRFELPLLPPGDYLAVATERVPLMLIGDPSPTLRALQSVGTRLTVRDGEQKTISIRASPRPEGLARFSP